MLIGGRKLEFIPAHYLHASANFHVYDAEAKIFFSGDVGAALLPTGHSIWVGGQGSESSRAFDEHIQHAKFFHQRWMPSNARQERLDRPGPSARHRLSVPPTRCHLCGDNVQRFLELVRRTDRWDRTLALKENSSWPAPSPARTCTLKPARSRQSKAAPRPAKTPRPGAGKSNRRSAAEARPYPGL